MASINLQDANGKLPVEYAYDYDISIIPGRKNLLDESLSPLKLVYDNIYKNALSTLNKAYEDNQSLLRLLPNDMINGLILQLLKEPINEDLDLLIYLCHVKKYFHLCTDESIKELFAKNTTFGLRYAVWSNNYNLAEYFMNQINKPNILYEFNSVDGSDVTGLLSLLLLPIVRHDERMLDLLLRYYPDAYKDQLKYKENWEEYLLDYIFTDFIDFVDKYNIMIYLSFYPAYLSIFTSYFNPDYKNRLNIYRKLINDIKPIEHEYNNEGKYNIDSKQRKLFFITNEEISIHQSPVQWAIAAEDHELVTDLLARGADPNYTAEYFDVEDYLPNIPDEFIYRSDRKDEVDTNIAWEISPLAIVAGLFDTEDEKISNLDTVKLLVENGANLEDGYNFKETNAPALAYDTESKQFTHEKNLKSESSEYVYTPLEIAKLQGNWDIYNYLKSKGAS